MQYSDYYHMDLNIPIGKPHLLYYTAYITTKTINTNK